MVKQKIEQFIFIKYKIKIAFQNEHKLFYHIAYEINEKQLSRTNK